MNASKIIRVIILSLLLLFTGVYSHAYAATIPPVDDAITLGKMAVATLEFPDLTDLKRGERKIPIKIHFPKDINDPTPVIIVSHGAGGNWDTHYAQAHHLASHGYIVLCVEHTGSNTTFMKRNLRWFKNLKSMVRTADEVLGRPKDISFAIDQAERWNRSHAMLHGKFDMKHVGVMGHSFGAYTTLAISGARPALDWLQPPLAPGKGIGPSLRDERVKCSVALSPQGVGEPFFLRESFAYLQIPVLGISGSKDKELSGDRPPDNRYQAFSLWPNAQGNNKYVWITNARHLDFTDAHGSNKRELPSEARAQVQTIVKAATLLFFNAHLKDDAKSKNKLTTEGLKLYLGDSINHVEVRTK